MIGSVSNLLIYQQEIAALLTPNLLSKFRM
jgi:hypothetical protein